MEVKKYPKVIVTSVDAWRDDVGANTLPNFFADWDPNQVCVVYTRPELPETDKCNSFFQIAENEVLHAVFYPGRKCGQRVYNESATFSKSAIDRQTENVMEEQKRYNFFRNHRLTIFYLIREMIWSLGAWKSKELEKFLEECDADTIFFTIYPYSYMNKIQSYIAKKAGLRGVAYIADDNYSYQSEWYNPLFRIRRFFLRKSIDEIMQYCDELLVILPKLKEEYETQFNIPINVLTKGIDVSEIEFESKQVKFPIKMVYTGNFFIGRDKTIISVVEAIKKINQNETKIQLDIYCHVPLSKRLKNKLNVSGCSAFKGAALISEMEQIQREADVVLFVEGLDVFNRNKARLSFSTKLTDYFKAGKCIFAVGKKNIAPIDYLIKNRSAIVATTKKEIYQQLKLLVENPQEIGKYGKAAYELGIQNHSLTKMKAILYHAMLKASRK